MKRSILMSWLLAMVVMPSLVSAANITVGEKLSPLAVEELGECVIEGDEVVFKDWDTSKLNGKVQVMEYMAARAGVDKVNENFFRALDAAGLTEKVGMAKLVNSDDALWGTGGMVAGEMKKGKKDTPTHTMVVDAEGLGRQQWDLKEKGVALAILDPNGEVLFFKEGALESDDIRAALAIIQSQLGLAANP